MRRVLLAVAGLALALASPAAAVTTAEPFAGVDSWLAYGHDAQSTNFVPSAFLTPETAPFLANTWTAQLDGAIVAAPLYAKNVSVSGRTQDVLLVSTEAGSMYALNPADGKMLWRDEFGTVTTPDNACGSFGFSSTGAIDVQRGLVYAISADGHLHALDLATGAEAVGWPVDVTVARNQIEYVWAGLRLVGDTLYVGVSSYCDQPGAGDLAAEGRVVAIDVKSGTETARFDPVPGYGNLGGVWGWGGVTVTPDGSALYTGVGNSYVRDASCACYVETVGYGNAMVELTPSLEPVASDRPGQVADTPPGADIDFGAAPVLFQPPGCPPLAAANNKLGVVYVWNRDALAKGPVFQAALGDGVAAFVGQPAYSPWLGMFFDTHAVIRKDGVKVGDGVAAFSVGPGCKIRARWVTNVGAGNEPPPIVVGNVVVAAGGDTGGYAALDARTGETEWRASTDGASTISPPIAVSNTIFAGDLGGVVRAFGLVLPARRTRGPARAA